jgi:PKD repeat protein
LSEGPNNNEQAYFYGPNGGTWFIGLLGGSSYRNVDLNVSYSVVPPGASFSGTPLNGIGPMSVHFTDYSTGSVASWHWDFGDGTTSTEQNPVHRYRTAGNFSVSLTVQGPGGSDTQTRHNHVNIPLVMADANNDGTLDLKDVVLGLQLMGGVKPDFPFDMEKDVDGGGRFGLENVIRGLQEVAETRQE